MGYMKNELINKYNEACNKVSNYMDGDYTHYVVMETEDIYNELQDMMEHLHQRLVIIDMMMDNNDTTYEDACEEFEEYEEYYQEIRDILK